MSDRYFAKVVLVQDKFTVVINAGSEKEVKVGKKFLIVGLGEVIVDPDTKEELERLEIVRGNAQVIHVQGKIATLRSSEYDRTADEREIKKVTARGGLAVFGGPQDTVTETTKPGEQIIREFRGVQVGDFAIAV
ncbi:MAG TPA: hypothetical protein GXX48_01435 [Ochrobactrum intermedium]|uniref:Uncharacterized protein n=1 Tax=Brucella intermedia TaxID=94625 RepID=A0A7V6TXZ2_9HYPH|nr:hypothetical protein [Brucella intermedia]HHV66300.1 hypothetical protein [Brucella intermedia]